MLDLGDIKLFKSRAVTNDNSNGGRMDELKVTVSGAKNAILPHVTHSQRTNGFTWLRKFFLANRSVDGEVVGATVCVLQQPTGGDILSVSAGGPYDTAADIDNDTLWLGSGPLFATIAAGATDIQVAFRDSGWQVPNGAAVYLENTVEGVNVRTSNEQYTQNVGTGESSYNVTLANAPVDEGSVKLTYTVGGTNHETADNGKGVIEGAGITDASINYATGEIEIAGAAILDDVSAAYARRCFQMFGNIAAIRLAESVPFSFGASDTLAGVCVDLNSLNPSVVDTAVTSAGGSINPAKIVLENRGAVDDELTVTFITPAVFGVTGLYEGTGPSGSVNTHYAPLNLRTGRPLITIPVDAWSGMFLAGDRIVIKTASAAAAVWLKSEVPAGTSREPNDEFSLKWFVE